MFGAEDGREITYRLSQRIAFFLASNQAEARQLFKEVKKAYSFRSKVAHGVWKQNVFTTPVYVVPDIEPYTMPLHRETKLEPARPVAQSGSGAK